MRSASFLSSAPVTIQFVVLDFRFLSFRLFVTCFPGSPGMVCWHYHLQWICGYVHVYKIIKQLFHACSGNSQNYCPSVLEITWELLSSASGNSSQVISSTSGQKFWLFPEQAWNNCILYHGENKLNSMKWLWCTLWTTSTRLVGF